MASSGVVEIKGEKKKKKKKGMTPAAILWGLLSLSSLTLPGRRPH